MFALHVTDPYSDSLVGTLCCHVYCWDNIESYVFIGTLLDHMYSWDNFESRAMLGHQWVIHNLIYLQC